MYMSEFELKIMIGAFTALLTVLGFIGAMAVRQLIKMSANLNEIKITISEINGKHDLLDEKHEGIKERVEKIENALFAA